MCGQKVLQEQQQQQRWKKCPAPVHVSSPGSHPDLGHTSSNKVDQPDYVIIGLCLGAVTPSLTSPRSVTDPTPIKLFLGGKSAATPLE